MSVTTSERAASTTGPLPGASIQLADLPQLTFDYLQSVQVPVNRVTGDLIRGDEGTFSVRVTNGGVRLTNWTLHLFSSDIDVAAIKAENGVFVQYRESGDRDAPTVPANSLHDELFAFFIQDGDLEPNDVLEPDEVREVRFSYRAQGAGEATFTAHLHGTVDVDSLFPRGNGVDATAPVEIKRSPRN